jgi:hypothetical protein
VSGVADHGDLDVTVLTPSIVGVTKVSGSGNRAVYDVTSGMLCCVVRHINS